MALCGISQLFSSDRNECPAECPFWAPSSVWKYIGVCSQGENCQLYNPILNYADETSNVCLPCKVFGCVSCRYSDPRESLVPVTDKLKKLPDYCLECARGFRRSKNGDMCYLVTSSLWTRMLVWILAATALCIAVPAARLALNRARFRANLKVLVAALKKQQQRMLRDPRATPAQPYSMLTDTTTHNISGVGLMLYFRHLVFLALVVALVFFASLAHAHIPCAKMIRIFREPFKVYYLGRRNEVPRGFIRRFFNKDANRLVDDIFNFKSADDAIGWNVVQYATDVSGVMYVLYVSVMIMTMVYLVSQKRTIVPYSGKSSKIKELTLVLKNLPREATSEQEVAALVHRACGVWPGAVSVCYDIKRHKKALDKVLEAVEDLREERDAYINVEHVESISRTLGALAGAGECFVTFESSRDARLALSRFERGAFEVYRCEVEPENVLWENVGHEERIGSKMLGIVLLTVTMLVAYTALFFVPYAYYVLTSPMKHVLEILLLSFFVESGNMLVSGVLRHLIERAGITNRETVDGYFMLFSFFLKLINLCMDIAVSHLFNYGGRRKLLLLLARSPFLATPTFRVGEEAAFGLSFTLYMVNILVLTPNALFVLTSYVLPIFSSFLVLALDLDAETAARALRYGTFSLSDAYATDLANFTCCLFLLFVIKDRRQGCLMFLVLFVSVLLNYAKSQFVVLRRSSRKLYSTWRIPYFAHVMWAFPTLVLALCPAYWDWRAGQGSLRGVLWAGAVHVLVYGVGLYFVVGPLTRPHVDLSLREVLGERPPKGFEESDYRLHNPVYRFNRVAGVYNVL